MSKRKILLAEDDFTMVSLLTTLLKMEGYDVVSLNADDDVLAGVRAHQPDALILDVHLFSQSGLDILQKLREAEDTSGVRVLMSSGANVREECMNTGADGFLLKPYMPDDLFKLLRQVIAA
ncbi:MAG: response regulator [Anaerolineales bacterium]|jgi:DNA-binding response OmpR family regulator|nr:response regulator [Chloroflexota bacterium]MBK6646516.1 response regulator [Anaerolineales bacterium]MCC6987322.1 response regulator [Anaerolineales bacterium]